MLSPALQGTLTDQSELLERLHVPPRLAAHPRLVHDVAVQPTTMLAEQLAFDRTAVLFGAATHDISKVVHPNELTWGS